MNEKRNGIIEKIRREKLIAILRGIPEDKLIPTVEAIAAGGGTLVEVTFDHTSGETLDRTRRGIAALCEYFGNRIEIGAGPVLDSNDVFSAKTAGASFMISPNTDENVIKLSRKMGLVSIPGAYTPSEVCSAYAWGADFVKLFPLCGDPVSYIRALRAPLCHIPMLAVGGIGPENLSEVMKTGVLGVGIGSGIASGREIEEFSKESDFAVISERVRLYRKLLSET